jgi:hypothetical protein
LHLTVPRIRPIKVKKVSERARKNDFSGQETEKSYSFNNFPSKKSWAFQRPIKFFSKGEIFNSPLVKDK